MPFFPTPIMVFVLCRFSVPFIFGFNFMPFFFIFGFCFMPFFPSCLAFVLCHFSLFIWLLFYAVFPFPLYMAFVLCHFSLHTWHLFYAVFSFILYMAFVSCHFSQSVYQSVNQSDTALS